jgi:hypothetical protein
LVLEHFQEELDYILENVEGNNNYGKEFVSAVEECSKTKSSFTISFLPLFSCNMDHVS